MAAEPKTFDELYEIGQNELQTRAPQVTDLREGSIADIFLGVTSTLAEEIQTLCIERFNRTFTELAEGDDLETLLTDHFGDSFARPDAQKATGIVTFSRPTFGAGAVTIPAGTVVSTVTDASGNSQKFQTVLEVSLGATDLTINATVEAQVAGEAGNVGSGTITVIDSSLTDPTITVNNGDSMSGGAEELTDAEYREWARNRIEAIRGGTCSAIEAAALTVSGVENAVAVEESVTVREWDVPSGTPSGDPFTLPRAKLYIADANGSADATLIADVRDAIEVVRACGVIVEIVGAVAQSFSWDISITLNPGGPNYTELSQDATEIRKTAQGYVNGLAVGADFIRADGETAIMAVWGPSGTNDLTDVDTNVPTGDVSTTPTEKLISNLVDITVS